MGKRFMGDELDRSHDVKAREPGLPLLPARPWDRRRRRPRFHRALVLFLKSSTAIVTVLAAGALAWEARAQAVGNPNGDIAPTGGALDGRSGQFLQGNVAVPVTPFVGFQANALGGEARSTGYWGVGADLFIRDPALGALGPIVIHEQLGSQTLQHYGAAGELYRGPVDIGMRAGFQGGNFRDGGFAEVEVGLYLTDDLEIATGSHDDAGTFFQTFDVEWLPRWQPLPTLSVFGDGAIGDHGSSRALVGVRLHFGDTKSLKDRHHQDGVSNPITFGFSPPRQPPPPSPPPPGPPPPPPTPPPPPPPRQPPPPPPPPPPSPHG